MGTRGRPHQSVEDVFSRLKRAIVGSYHMVSVKHLPAYIDEMEWRYNNRDNPYLFRDTFLAAELSISLELIGTRVSGS